MTAAVHPIRVLAFLAQEESLLVVAALALGAPTAEDIVRATELPTRRVRAALARAVEAGVATHEGETYTLRPDVFKRALAAASRRPAPPAETDPRIRGFFRGERLESIPVARPKRLLVLELLAGRFEPGQLYSEKEVNETLRQFHPDYATLRRYLVDEGFMDRGEGKYWRAGTVITTKWKPPR